MRTTGTTPRSSASDRAHPRRGGGRRDRRLVAVRLLDGRDPRAPRLRRAAAHHAGGVRDVLARGARGRRGDVRRPCAVRADARRGRPGRTRGRGGGGARGGDRRGARRADSAAGAPAGARVVAAANAGPARRGALRGAARARVHDVHPHVRGLGAGRRERRRRRSGARPGDRPGLRRGPAAAGDRAGAGRRDRVGRRRARGDGRTPPDPALAARGRRPGDGRLRARPRRLMAERLVTGGSDPSADGALIAWHVAGQPGVIVSGGQQVPAGGSHPALGGGRLAVIGANVIQVRETSGPPFAATIPAPGADAVAVSADWVAWRARDAEGDTILAAPLAGGPVRRIARSAELGRPALAGGTLAY